MSDDPEATTALVYHTVERGDLPITVTERGNLESQSTEEIICEVESFGGDSSGVTGTQILYIVPNGSTAKKGDLLVELDQAPLQERLDSQFLALERATAEKKQAISKYENQKIKNRTSLTEAELELELAMMALNHYLGIEKFEDFEQIEKASQIEDPGDEAGGLFAIELQNIDLEIQTKLATQMIAKENREAIEMLHKLGFRNRGELETAEVSLLQSQSELATTLAEKRQLEKYTYKKEMLSRLQEAETAQNNLDQVKLNNDSKLRQGAATRDSAIRAYEKEQERYDRYQEQLEQCKIHAPQDGMVAYAMETNRRSSNSVIEEGAFVRQRQKILNIPDLSRMQVETAIHESVMDQVKKGLKAVIRVDAFPKRRYPGTVKSVAVLPDEGGWLSSDAKTYETKITIDDEVQQLKPGMTTVVEIDIEQLRDVISVPIQAIIQRGDTNWCYVRTAGKLERRKLSLGKTNDKFVEVRDGLAEGEVVVLNPESLVAESDKEKKESDEGAEELKKDRAADEKPKAAQPRKTEADRAGGRSEKKLKDR